MSSFEDYPENEDLIQQVEKINSCLKIQDFYHMLYLRPLQCVLDQNKGGLAKGLRIVSRKSQNQYDLKQVKQIHSFQQFQNLSQSQKVKLSSKDGHQQNSYFEYVEKNQGDNLLSQMKTHGAIEIAICICMYNEDRAMLNNTLSGVGENIINLYKQGIDPDKIVVIIVQDGIEKMDPSVFQLFNVFQVESGMKFNSGKKKNVYELIQKLENLEKTKTLYGWQGQDTFVDVNSFLFSEQEEKRRDKLRFINVKKQYDAVKKLFKQVSDLLKKKNITHEDLPPKALEFFKQECRLLMTQGKQIDQNDSEQKLKEYFEIVSQNLNKSKPLIYNALTKTKQFCEQYINSRSEMSHVSFFRTSQYFPDDSGLGTNYISQLSLTDRRTINLHKTHSEKDKLIDDQTVTGDKVRQQSTIKMNLFFVVKYRNNQKLSSHNWFFNGFCKEFSNCQFQSDVQVSSQASEAKPKRVRMSEVSPKYTILLDVGLRPEGTALCKMYNTMINHPKIGGVCGYMGLKIEKNDYQSQNQLSEKIDFVSNFFMNFVDIQRAQQLQYHFAHLIDKGFESIFKFIHVLPGAFSGYNMNAIWGSTNEDEQQKQSNSDKLLQSYFKSINDKLKDKTYKNDQLSFLMILVRILLPDVITRSLINQVSDDSYEHLMYESNVYLAEDRILCMGIHKNNFDLMFLPDAYSFVDPVKDIPSLMGQRKRWINGSYFAFEKVSDQFRQMGCCQVLSIQIWYLALMNMLAFIAPGFYMFSVSVAMQVVRADILAKLFSDTLNQNSQIYSAFVYTINFFYGLLILGLIYFSINLNNRNDRFVKYVYAVSTVLGTISVVMLIILVVDLARGLSQSSSYLISNQSSTFIQSIPGGQATVDIIRYIVLGIMGLYAVPLVFYSLLFRNIRVMFQIILGTISFAFYSPTYLIVLNIYALCRMDDLSWGTKGLEASGSGKDKEIQNNWKIIKTIHVAKLIFWNVVVAGLLIHWGSSYLVRFYLTFALMVIIALTMALKVILAIFYYLYYKICINSDPVAEKKENGTPMIQPSLYKYFKSDSGNPSLLETQLRKRVKQNIYNLLIGSELGYDRRVSLLLLKLFNQATQKMSKTQIFERKLNEISPSEVKEMIQQRKQGAKPSGNQLSLNVERKSKVQLTPIKKKQRLDLTSEKLLSPSMNESLNGPQSHNELIFSRTDNTATAKKLMTSSQEIQLDQEEWTEDQQHSNQKRQLNFETENRNMVNSVRNVKPKELEQKRSDTDHKKIMDVNVIKVQTDFKKQAGQFGQFRQSQENSENNGNKKNSLKDLLRKSQKHAENPNNLKSLIKKQPNALEIDDLTN